MGIYFWPAATSLSQQQMADAVEMGLDQYGAAKDESVLSLAPDLIATRYHDCGVTNIPDSGDTPVEIAIDDSTPGAALADAISKIQVSCTFGAGIEILSGASAGAAVRRAVLNLGDGPVLLDCKIAAGQHIYVRAMAAADVTEGVLTLNLMGPA